MSENGSIVIKMLRNETMSKKVQKIDEATMICERTTFKGEEKEHLKKQWPIFFHLSKIINFL